MDSKSVRVEIVAQLPQAAKSSYMDELSYETSISRLQIMMFDENGKLDKYVDGPSLSQKIETSAGNKTVYAVANGPSLSGISNIDELRRYGFLLSDNDKNSGFVMAGCETCTLMAGEEGACIITLSRLLARIALVKLVNNLPSAYGNIKLEAAWLANVPAEYSLSGNISLWHNKYSRCDEQPQVESHIINGAEYKASCEELTYVNVSETISSSLAYSPSSPLCLYTLPNPSTLSPQPFSNSFAPQMTMIVLRAIVSGTEMYYSIPLDKQKIEANTAYGVSVTLTGIGDDEPQHVMEHSKGNASIKIEAWKEGVYYDTTI